MFKVVVTNCCGCIGLRSGVITISVLRIVTSSLLFVVFLIALNAYEGAYETVKDENKENWNYINYIINEGIKILIPYFIFFLALEIVLLVGVLKVNPNLILLHQVINGSILVVNLVCIFILSIAFPWILLNLFGMVIPTYFWIVIHSYHMSIINQMPIHKSLGEV